MRNETDEPVRYLIFSTKPSSDIVEYPDSGKVGLGSRGKGWRILADGAQSDYWAGE